jgi:hypothetical protein
VPPNLSSLFFFYASKLYIITHMNTGLLEQWIENDPAGSYQSLRVTFAYKTGWRLSKISNLT